MLDVQNAFCPLASDTVWDASHIVTLSNDMGRASIVGFGRVQNAYWTRPECIWDAAACLRFRTVQNAYWAVQNAFGTVDALGEQV